MGCFWNWNSFATAARQNFQLCLSNSKADVTPPAEETGVPEGFEHFCALKFDPAENFTAATCQILSRSN